MEQRESTATIKAAPATYELAEPPKAKNLIEIDCRGLEFTDFKPDVRLFLVEYAVGTDPALG